MSQQQQHTETPVQRRERLLQQLDATIADGTHPWVAYIVRQLNEAGLREGTVRIHVLHVVTRLTPPLPHITYTELDLVCQHFRTLGEDISLWAADGALLGRLVAYDGKQRNWDDEEDFESTTRGMPDVQIHIELRYTDPELIRGRLVRKRKPTQAEEEEAAAAKRPKPTAVEPSEQ